MSKANHDFWARLAAHRTPAGALATIENPRTVGLLVIGALGGAAVIAAGFGIVLVRFGETGAGWATLGLALAYVLTWIWHAATGQVTGPAWFATAASIANQLALHFLLGGFAYSGAYLGWGVTMTFALALMLGRMPAIGVGVFYIVTAAVLGSFESTISAMRSPPPLALTTAMFVATFAGNLAMVTAVLAYFLRRLAFERARAEALLLNVLPREIAAELKEVGRTSARRFDEISVLFADIVGFTSMTANSDPEEMVQKLNRVFTHFDELTAAYGCEKIRTIGDAYMVAAGVPIPRSDHAHCLTSIALQMLDYGRRVGLTFRIGISSGPAVAGVIGIQKFQYDVWGDTVNTASRMESHGEPGRIQVSEATYRRIGGQFACIPRGEIEVKGKGSLSTWWVEGPATPRS